MNKFKLELTEEEAKGLLACLLQTNASGKSLDAGLMVEDKLIKFLSNPIGHGEKNKPTNKNYLISNGILVIDEKFIFDMTRSWDIHTIITTEVWWRHYLEMYPDLNTILGNASRLIFI